MSTRPRIPAMAGAVCAALLLAGCSSSGTVGAGGSSSGGVGGLTGATSGGNSGPDTGCTQAMLAIQNAEKAQTNTNLQAAVSAANTSIGQLRAAALATQKPGGRDAMNKVADDLQAIVTQVAAGHQPDTTSALRDAQIVAGICGM
ncbi:hypothetical protein [Catenulispora rubra]|uniref:hypothetical protein n=1 Tax=Catenulispora rubra TaxID=280293 RepID=UPI0018926A25|nr:hypothetical protein [Catenulispora rubra]